MIAVMFFLLSSLFAVEPPNEEFYHFEKVNGVRTMSAEAIAAWKSLKLPKQHLGALIDRKALRDSIVEFFETTELPTKLICYSNDITVAELLTFFQKTDEELQGLGNAYVFAVSASFDVIKKMQAMGKNLRNIKSFDVFSDDEREGFRQFSYAIERPGHYHPPASNFLEVMHVNDPWSSVALHISQGAEFAQPNLEKPLKGRTAVRAIVANLIYDMTSQETTSDRVRYVMQRYLGCFCVIPIKNQDDLDELGDTKKVPIKAAVFSEGCLALRTKGQLIFPFPIEKGGQEEKMCALVPTFGFVWGGPGHIMQEEGGYDVGSFFDALVGGPRKRSRAEEIYAEHLHEEKITDTSTAPKPGHERFLLWHVGAGYGMGLLLSNTALPRLGEATYVRLRVCFSGFAKGGYYANDHAGPGVNEFSLDLKLKDDGVFDEIHLNGQFFIVEKKTQQGL